MLALAVFLFSGLSHFSIFYTRSTKENFCYTLIKTLPYIKLSDRILCQVDYPGLSYNLSHTMFYASKSVVVVKA